MNGLAWLAGLAAVFGAAIGCMALAAHWQECYAADLRAEWFTDEDGGWG